MKPRIRHILTFIAAASLGLLPAYGEERESLDSLFEDAGAQPKGAAAQLPAEKEAAAPVPAGSLKTAAPLCSLQAFQDSPLVKKGGWPGVGPFKEGASGPLDLVDTSLNHLRIKVDDEKVTEAELALNRDRLDGEDILDLTMPADFLLEALGCRARKIADFNNELEKKKGALCGLADGKEMGFSAGKYVVSISRGADGVSDKQRYLIRVSSRDINREAIKEHSVAPGDGGETATGTTGEVTAVATAAGAGGTPASDALKEEFLAVVKNWQNVKRTVTRSRQTAQLSECLSGKALALQTNTINWLVTNRKYWDITPKSVSVDKYTEVTPGRKYVVLAQVKQTRKYVDDATGQVLKEALDDDRVNYTVEKIGERWFITDYSIVTSGGAPQAARPQAGKASR